MTARQAQIAVEELREQFEALEQRVDARLAALEVAAAPVLRAQPAQPAFTNGGAKQPHWLDFVRFGNKPCAGGCGTVIAPGPGRVWYEQATANRKAQMFCEPCGKPRDPNGGRP